VAHAQAQGHKVYLRVSWLISIYSGKRPNEHAIIVDRKGKRVEGTEEKLELCAMFFDKLYNCAPVVKLFAKLELEELRPLLSLPHIHVHPHFNPMPRLRACLY
jgi:hypothetical protein